MKTNRVQGGGAGWAHGGGGGGAGRAHGGEAALVGLMVVGLKAAVLVGLMAVGLKAAIFEIIIFGI